MHLARSFELFHRYARALFYYILKSFILGVAICILLRNGFCKITINTKRLSFPNDPITIRYIFPICSLSGVKILLLSKYLLSRLETLMQHFCLLTQTDIFCPFLPELRGPPFLTSHVDLVTCGDTPIFFPLFILSPYPRPRDKSDRTEEGG